MAQKNGTQDPTIAQLIPLIQTKTAITGTPINQKDWNEYKKMNLILETYLKKTTYLKQKEYLLEI